MTSRTIDAAGSPAGARPSSGAATSASSKGALSAAEPAAPEDGRTPARSAWAVPALFALQFFCCLLFLALGCGGAAAAEVIPPVPTHYFNDYASVVSPDTASGLDKKLEDFERETSNQILVAIYPHMQSDSSIEDYTVRVAQAWKVGQKQKNNGAVLFVFVQDHKMYLQVGYGLEGALPDALAKQIIDNELTPRFGTNDFSGGLSAGVAAILAATKGEYKGTGHTGGFHIRSFWLGLLVFIGACIALGGGGLLFFFLVVALIRALLRACGFKPRVGRGRTYCSGRSSGWFWSAGSSSGGSFSSGGGSFGGGGAGGSW